MYRPESMALSWRTRLNGKILEIRSVSKSFPGVKALDNVSLELHGSEVLALVGENGAGKSTLLKILSGAYLADAGELYLHGQLCNFSKPVDGYNAGISIIYQELNYLDELTIGENIFLGRLPKKAGLIDWQQVRIRSAEALDKVGFMMDPSRLMKTLTVAQKQLVEIAKAISRDMKVLVMDEPTSALNDEEVESLLKLIKRIAVTGVGVIYISHRMNEIFSIADRVQVLRDGCNVGAYDIKEVDEDSIIKKMVGREINEMFPKVFLPIGETLLEVKDMRGPSVGPIDLTLRSGEILGIFGLMGAGRTAFAETLFGRHHKLSGSFFIKGKEVIIKTPQDARNAGIGYVPAERKKDGLILEHSVSRNISTASISRLKKYGLVSSAVEQKFASHWIEKFKIKTPSSASIVKGLSGGNQQKVVLAKWLQTRPLVLILNEPTRGIDVGAKVEIYKLIVELCREGMGIILISSELPEVLALSDRVMVMAGGTFTGEIADRKKMDQEALMKLAISRTGGNTHEF
jgi:ABC-type sugar transport system ATPase subunit